MTYYMRAGNTTTITDSKNVVVTENLNPSTYAVRFDQNRNMFYLQDVDPFENPKKIYGDVMSRVHRIVKTFDSREGSTGVLLSGEKGSGKTMLARLLSIEFAKKRMPTLIVTSPFCGDAFNSFIQSIDDPCIIIFDEFEKVYDADDQQQLLTLFDGVYQTRKLFVVTTNDPYVNQNMLNRPGRMFYHFSYGGLEEDFIREYCKDNLKNQDNIDAVVNVTALYRVFNFDMLQALVEEMNRFGEQPKESLRFLNARPDEFDDSYKVAVFDNDGKPAVWCSPDYYSVDPHDMAMNVQADFKAKTEAPPGMQRKRGDADVQVLFTSADLFKIDVKSKAFVYRKDGYTMKLTRVSHSYRGNRFDLIED